MTVVPLVSVIVPTRNRVSLLASTLAALDRQECPPSAFEVIVVANGCSDGTLDLLRTSQHRFDLRVEVLEPAGASLARNRGAAIAAAPLLVFLDDDVEVVPGFVGAHVEAHGGTPQVLSRSRRVAIGYLPARLQPEDDRFAHTLRGWWEAMFDRMRDPGHRFSWTDLLSGNFSVGREWFIGCGMFDVALECHEDYELGHRLIQAGSTFVFAGDAAGWHDDRTRVAGACRRKRAEGEADAWIARRHPELRTGMPMTRAATSRQRLARWLAFTWPSLGDLGARGLVSTLPALDRVGASMTWMRVLYAVLGYWYERGLADALGSRQALRQLLKTAWAEAASAGPELSLDLAQGFDAAGHSLDRHRPGAARIVVGSASIGRIPWVPGSERLAGRHLLPFLLRHYHRKTVATLLAAGALSIDDLLCPGPVPARAPADPRLATG